MKILICSLFSLALLALSASGQGTNVTISADGTFQVPTNTLVLSTNWVWRRCIALNHPVPAGFPAFAVAQRVVSRAGNFSVNAQTNAIAFNTITNGLWLIQVKGDTSTNYMVLNNGNLSPWTNQVPDNAP